MRGEDYEPDLRRGERLCYEGVLLGDPLAQADLATHMSESFPGEQSVWMRRSAIQEGGVGLFRLAASVVEQLKCYDEGGIGRAVFEIGFGFDTVKDWRKVAWKPSEVTGGERCVGLYRHWCEEAKRAVLCWLWVAKQLVVSKDVRLLIADLIWDERAAWCANRLAEGAVVSAAGDEDEDEKIASL